MKPKPRPKPPAKPAQPPEPPAAPRPRGRPAAPIDHALVEKLAAMFCTDKEIAAFCQVAESTLKKRAAKELANGRRTGAVSLKRKQYLMAIEGDRTMLIWLGKQYLGQRDRIDQTHDLKGSKRPEELTDAELTAIAAGKGGQRIAGPEEGEE